MAKSRHFLGSAGRSPFAWWREPLFDRRNPLVDARRYEAAQLIEQAGGTAIDNQHFAVGALEKTTLFHVREKLQQMIEVAVDVEHADRLRVDAELQPGENLEQFLRRADAAGQRDETVGKIGHLVLARVHRVDGDQ